MKSTIVASNRRNWNEGICFGERQVDHGRFKHTFCLHVAEGQSQKLTVSTTTIVDVRRFRSFGNDASSGLGQSFSGGLFWIENVPRPKLCLEPHTRFVVVHPALLLSLCTPPLDSAFLPSPPSLQRFASSAFCWSRNRAQFPFRWVGDCKGSRVLQVGFPDFRD